MRFMDVIREVMTVAEVTEDGAEDRTKWRYVAAATLDGRRRKKKKKG